MQIISLEAENVKRLVAIKIEPQGNVVTISGANGAGKSSVLDSIWMCLAGGAGAKETTEPIRRGEKKARVRIDLGEYVVERRWTEKGSTLEISNAEGATFKSPQTMLDGLLGKLTLDPLAFAMMDARTQRETLLEVSELPFDPTALAAERQKVYDERTQVNRDVAALRAKIEGTPEPPEGTPDEEIDPGALAAEIDARVQKAQDHRSAFEERDELARQIQALEKELAAARENLSSRSKFCDELEEPADPEELRIRLRSVNETNAAVRAKKERDELKDDLQGEEKFSATLTTKLEEIDEQKASGLAEASLPLPGLSFDETGVLYQGLPFSQASASEKLRVSVAVAMALNPEIRVLRITDGSLLDSANLALLGEMAAEQDFQCWIERVDESGTLGIVIEDGMVKS